MVCRVGLFVCRGVACSWRLSSEFLAADGPHACWRWVGVECVGAGEKQVVTQQQSTVLESAGVCLLHCTTWVCA